MRSLNHVLLSRSRSGNHYARMGFPVDWGYTHACVSRRIRVKSGLYFEKEVDKKPQLSVSSFHSQCSFNWTKVTKTGIIIIIIIIIIIMYIFCAVSLYKIEHMAHYKYLYIHNKPRKYSTGNYNT